MSTVTPRRTMTLEEFRDLPEDETADRMLLRGVVVETVREECDVTRRNRRHALIEAEIARQIGNWIKQQPEIPGLVFSGEVGCEFPEQETSFGIDVAFFSKERLQEQVTDGPYISGAPLLAVEILSPSDVQKEIQRKTDIYLEAGTQVVWVVDPHFRTVTVFKRETSPSMFSGNDQLLTEPLLPGFEVTVSTFFDCLDAVPGV